MRELHKWVSLGGCSISTAIPPLLSHCSHHSVPHLCVFPVTWALGESESSPSRLLSQSRCACLNITVWEKVISWAESRIALIWLLFFPLCGGLSGPFYQPAVSPSRPSNWLVCRWPQRSIPLQINGVCAELMGVAWRLEGAGAYGRLGLGGQVVWIGECWCVHEWTLRFYQGFLGFPSPTEESSLFFFFFISSPGWPP